MSRWPSPPTRNDPRPNPLTQRVPGPSSRGGAFRHYRTCAVTGEHLSIQEARALAAIASRLDRRPRPTRDPAVQKARLLEMIRALGCVQLDTISVVSRSHETVLWSRLGPYDPALLGALHYPDGLLTEYWAHAAAIIPVETFPYFRDAMDAHREKYERHAWIEGNQDVISGVLERIRARRRDGFAPLRAAGRPASRGVDMVRRQTGAAGARSSLVLWRAHGCAAGKRLSARLRRDRAGHPERSPLDPALRRGAAALFHQWRIARPWCGDGALGRRLFPDLGPSPQYRQGERGRIEGVAGRRAAQSPSRSRA